jgi:hypothetical protein
MKIFLLLVSGTGWRRQKSRILPGSSLEHTTMPGHSLSDSRPLVPRASRICVVRGCQWDEQSNRDYGSSIWAVSPDPNVIGRQWSNW